MVALLPTPLTLSGLGSPSSSSSSASAHAAEVEKVQPHLMPFTIEYHGPAPVSTFLLLRPEAQELAPGSAIPAAEDQTREQGQQEKKKKREATYTAAFRGRAMHGTTIPLPAGWSGAVLDVESEAEAQIRWASSSSSASSSSGPAKKANGHSAKLNGTAKSKVVPAAAVVAAPESPQRRTSPRKKAGLPQPPPPAASPPKKKAAPAVAKRFTMDSDSDSDASSSDEGVAGAGSAPAPESATAAGTTSWPPVSSQQSDLYDADEAEDGDRTLQPGADGEGESDAEKRAASRTSVHARSRQLRTVGQFDRLLVWSPDGPVDRGDDVYVRTLTEWHGVIVPAIHSH